MRLCAVVAIVGCLASAHAGEVPWYEVTDLGTLHDTWVSEAWGINELGQVAVRSYTSGYAQMHAARWDSTLDDLGTGGRDKSYCYRIGEDGTVVGGSLFSGGSVHATIWRGGTAFDLVEGTGSYGSEATDISDSGLICGSMWYTTRATAGLHGGGNRLYGLGMNNSGQVTGFSYVSGTVYHSYLWDGAKYNDLGTLDGAVGSMSQSWDVTEGGAVVGTSTVSGGGAHAFVWDPSYGGGTGLGGHMRDLGTLGGNVSRGYAMNDAGWVVGESAKADNQTTAFVWDGTSMVDLQTRLVDPTVFMAMARGINNSGQIVGWGWVDGEMHGLLLEPTPELPTASLLLLSALPVGIAWRRKRWRQGAPGAAGVDGGPRRRLPVRPAVRGRDAQ